MIEVIAQATEQAAQIPHSGVIDDRRDEVGCRDQRPMRVKLPHGGVVASVGAHHKLRVVVGLQMAHDVRQLARGELAASTGSVAELCEANPIAFTHMSTLATGRPGQNASSRCVALGAKELVGHGA